MWWERVGQISTHNRNMLVAVLGPLASESWNSLHWSVIQNQMLFVAWFLVSAKETCSAGDWTPFCF